MGGDLEIHGELITSDLPLNRVMHLMWVQLGMLLLFAAMLAYVLAAMASDTIVFHFGGSAYFFGGFFLAGVIGQFVAFMIWKRQLTRSEPDPCDPEHPLFLAGKPMFKTIHTAIWLSTFLAAFVTWLCISYCVRFYGAFPWPIAFPLTTGSEFVYQSHLQGLLSASLAGIVVLSFAVAEHTSPVATVTSLKKKV